MRFSVGPAVTRPNPESECTNTECERNEDEGIGNGGEVVQDTPRLLLENK